VAARRGRGASRGSKGPSGWLWLLAGILIGLGLAWYLAGKGFLPKPRSEPEQAPAESVQMPAPATDEEVAPRGQNESRPQYDFFTVLPEMEVVVPEQELSKRVAPAEAAAPAASDNTAYLLQVGSFRSAADAEQLKARLALLGVVARVQTVTVNDVTWHRVRVGPVAGARQADEMRSRLAANGIDTLVLKDQ
jgi:cell division protein FtsN